MSNPSLISYLEGMKKKFWHERRHLQQDEVNLQWAAKAAPLASILFNTEAPTQPLDITSTQGQQMAHQFTSKSWTEAVSARRRASATVTPLEHPLELGQIYENGPSSALMSRKRARTSQYGPGTTAETATTARSLDSIPLPLDSNAPYCGYTSTSTSSPSFKARRTPAGRMPINIQHHSPTIRVYEPEEYLQQSRAFQQSGFSPETGPQSSLDNHCIPSSSHETPAPFSISPTTTVSEIYTDTTPPTSAAMSRQDSLATSFCGAFGMMRADSGISEINLGQNMYRQDSYSGLQSSSLSPDGQKARAPFDTSLYFAHAEGTAIETSPDSLLAVEHFQLPATSELDTEMKRDVSSSFMPVVDQRKPLPTLELHTKMRRDTSSVSDLSSSSRVSRRSQEQIAQAAARPIAPKDVAESPRSKQWSSLSLSGSQDMLRQRSAPEMKMQIPKLQYSRHTKEKLKCDRCNKNPDGYRGSHELHRHMALDHNSSRTAWVCVDISSDGFLSGCSACESKKPYGQDYNAAAHLRRFHFHPKSEVRRTNVNPEERRGGKGGGKDPPMSECRRWMEKIQVPGKDFMALADSAVNDVNDAGNDTVEDDEASEEEQGEQDEVEENVFLPESIQKYDDNLQPYDSVIGPQISTSPLDGVSSAQLATTNDRRFEDPQFSVQPVGVPFSQTDLQSTFEMPLDTYFDSNTASFTSPSIDVAYSHPPFSSSAPATFSFLSSNSADPASTLGNVASSIPDPSNQPSTVSTTSTAHTQEDFYNFHPSFIPSYGMPSPHNPQASYGLSDFTPFR